MKKRLIALLLAVVLCVGLLPVSASAAGASVDWVDCVDEETGGLDKNYIKRTGEYAEEIQGSADWTEKVYIVKADSTVTIHGDLTVGRNTTIILCDNSRLIVTGSLNLKSNGYIFGQTSTHKAENAGTLIVQNTVDAGAAVRSTSGYGLSIYGGSMELHGGAGKQITDGKATLHSNSKITKGTLDGKALKLNEWNDKEALAGSKLVLKYCEHDNEDTEFVHDEGANTHHRHCNACGLDYRSESCNFNGGDTINAGAEGHYRTCWCGNKESTTTEHTLVSVPTRDGQGHVSGCAYCDYKSGGFGDPHNWYDETGKNTGECQDCGFSPVAEDDYSNLYGSVEDALKAATEGYKVKLYTVKDYAEGEEKVIYESAVFNAPGKTAELDMNGYTLIGNIGPTLTVKNGTLTVTGDAAITQPGRFPDTAAPAIEVTGGKLIVNGDLTAEGGIVNGNRKPAVEATGGEIEFNGNLKLGGGLTLLKDAKLTKLLSQGFFWSGDGTNQDTLNDRIDLWGGSDANKSKHYTALSDILENGYALAYCDMDGNPTLEDGSYKFYGLFGNEASSVNVTIVEHPQHTWESLDEDRHYCTACKTRAAHTLENGGCSVCGYTCPHSGASLNTETGNYECSACGMTMVARSEKGGATTYYSILGTALAGAENGATVTLLTDLTTWEVSRGGDVYGKEITLDLNGHSITPTPANGYAIGVKSGGPGVQDVYLPATLKIVGEGNITPALIVLPGGKLDLSGWTGGTINYVSMSDRPVVGDDRAEPALIVGTGAGHIQDLTYSNWLIGRISQTTLSGGSYGKIVWMNYEDSEQPAFPTSAMLASGYAFKNSDGSYVLYTKTLERNEAFTNVSVVKCPHGALVLNETDGNYHCGYCNADMSNMAAEVTYEDGTTGYIEKLSDAFRLISEVTTAKLLRDITDEADDDLQIENPKLTIDLNGKTVSFLSVIRPGIKLKDSVGTGKINHLMWSYGRKLNDQLESGDYAFKSGDNWLADAAGPGEAFNVSIAKAPIKDVYFFEGEEKEENKITSLTKTYGDERALKASIVWGDNSTGGVSQAIYLVKDIEGVESLEEVSGGTSYGLPLFDYAGTYTYRFTATSDGYSKSADITVTVEPADIARVEVGLTDQGKLMFTPNPTTGEGTQVTAQVSSVSFKNRTQDASEYTVSGNTGVNVGDYELTITAAPDSKKFTGTKKVSWKITPFTLGYFKLPWSIEKDYDGTTALPNKPRDWFTDGFENRTTLLPESSTIYLKAGNLYTYSATYVDANAGEGKEINATFQLTSDNYRFASDLTGVSADGKTLTLENWQNGYPKFNINKIDMPNFDKTVAATVVNDLARTYEIPLPALPALTAPHEYGTITYAIEGTNLTNGYEAATAQLVKDGEQYKLSLTVPAVQFAREESVGTITVKVTTTNYNDVTLTVNVNTTNKLQPTVKVSADPNPFIYGTKLGDVALTATAVYDGNPVAGTIAWDDPADTILDKGIYEKAWTFTPTDGSTYREVKGKLDIQVTKATLTGAPVFGKITENGKTLNDVQIDFDNILGVDGKQPVLGFDWTDDHSTVIEANKSYGWTIDAGSNYELLTGSAVLYPRSSGYSDQVKRQSEEFEAKKRGELPEDELDFRDVYEDDYFFDAVQWAAENGITGGVGNDRFGPNLDCSRGQTMTFLWRASGEPEPDSFSTDLTDVAADSYYYEAVLWAMQEGVTTGAGAGRFAPDATVTRGQFVTFLYRLANASSDGVHPFADVPAGSYYEKAIAWAFAEGITRGTSGTTFSPDAPCTRAQIITFLYRYFNR